MNLEPLIGLATDEVDRATVQEHDKDTYHCNYNSDGEERKHVVINLFIGPKALTSASWKKLLKDLARKSLLSIFIIDKAHYVKQSGRHFRPEFESAVKLLGHLLTLMSKGNLVVLISATSLQDDVDRCCTDLLGRPEN